MALDGQNAAMQTENYIVMPDLLATTQQALESVVTLLKEVTTIQFLILDVVFIYNFISINN